jgi:dihydrofolate reductase
MGVRERKEVQEMLCRAYGNKPVFVLTSRKLPRNRNSVEFYSGDLAQFVNRRLRPAFRSIWFVGGGSVSGECLRLGLADEVRYSILPILIGDGIRFFEKLERDVALHLTEVKGYRSGVVALCYEVRAAAKRPNPPTAAKRRQPSRPQKIRKSRAARPGR